MIEIKDLCKSFGNNIVLNNLTLSIKDGETKVVIGRSGVGKSVFLKNIIGIIRPDSGSIRINGQEVVNLPEREYNKLRMKIGMVFQGGALFDSMTVGENVSFRLREHGLAPPGEIEERVQSALQFVGLSGARKLKPAQLSGGMKKRVAIARALAAKPEVILFDEPTTGLDPINSYNMEQLILKLKESRQVTIVIVTHDVGSALRLADSVAMLHEGKFIFEGSPGELQQSSEPVVRAFREPGSIVL